MNITAEGVENSEQADFLKEVACNHFQGFLFSKPMGSEELAGYLLGEFQDEIAKQIEDSGDPDPDQRESA